MIGLPTIHGEGRLVGDPELRFTPTGHAVTKFKLAFNGRRYDKSLDKWVEDRTTYMTCNAWRDLAENVAESFVKGDLVVITGHVVQRDWEDKQGNKRTAYDIEVDNVGASAKFTTVKYQTADRSTGDDTDTVDPWANDPWKEHAQ
jgi:single-strand DNA-binding protein